jgi:hypothetical protein
MLLDEADVFLERRATSDLQRNSLVTGRIITPFSTEITNTAVVFLRTMEYYRGILFLTTNRVGHFDDAFISRIHVVLRYDNFTTAERARIWEQFFAKLEKERGKYIFVPRATKKYVLNGPEMTNIAWNGREIRNSKPRTIIMLFFLERLVDRLLICKHSFPNCRCSCRVSLLGTEG